jgi:hypothetical protein
MVAFIAEFSFFVVEPTHILEVVEILLAWYLLQKTLKNHGPRHQSNEELTHHTALRRQVLTLSDLRPNPSSHDGHRLQFDGAGR